jgi:hypothetical protein
MKRYREWHVNKHSVFYSQGFRKNQLRNNFGVFLTFFKVVLVLFVQKWKVKNIAFKLNAQVQVQQLQDKTKNSREEIQRGNREKKRQSKGRQRNKKEEERE